ncbi:MAG TPA: hypothetical protein VK177_05630 [Flavobacteriales bacterium]|nr:hypothetical protein [Flavobacteriales bacterium]
MTKVLVFLLLLLPVLGIGQIKPAKLAGAYYGKMLQRMPYKKDGIGEKKTLDPNREVKLYIKKNKKCTFKTNLFTSQGTWEISADSVLTCTFKNTFGDKKSIEESTDIKKYKVSKDFVLIPVQAKTGKLYKR